MIGIVMFFAALAMLTIGYPVAFTFGSVSIFFGIFAAIIELAPNLAFVPVAEEFFQMFSMMPFRIYSIMNNTILMAIPLFIFMGIILQKSELAERLLEAMGTLFGKVRGGVAVSTVLVGALLAASTGVVGASVVAMGVISLPVMLKYGYSKKLATGTICAAGTLGQIIPPSIVLIILGDVFQQPVGDLFQAAFAPGLILVALYIIYILIWAFLNKEVAPPLPPHEGTRAGNIKRAVFAIIPPLTLIVLVLGSIFAGIATPTESASVGSVGAVVLAGMYRKLSWRIVDEAALETVKITAMVFAILIGATAFSMVFVYSGADYIVEETLTNLPGQKWTFLFLSMLAILVLGFFIDFIEISYIVVPILLPIAEAIGLNPLWFAILIAMNLQTSFLTPPFGFSLFYLKGVCPPEVSTVDLYRGVIPFIAIQILVLASIIFFPTFYGFSQ
ncbi:TRAP transporter large permease subunit [Desulforhopalus sp. IMCC35007]|uniref:TRAP transporter large permease n=1 Tax=Desulforhopalus sp. IMCC35007 TaxID=2569543 RepID=UPI0010AED26D|nr:TRAP transporter large permease subunit [Desulforhopalus sp. IMCC35007]TKB06202.1 TRAP transporter large permease subunit [Desulforhopalus sp. IMCC35007]